MKRLLVISAACLFLLAVYVQNGSVSAGQHDVVLVADQFYWAGPEGNSGLEIVGKFKTEEILKQTFDLTKEVGEFNGKVWTLRQILLSVDFNATGNVATWKVCGPKPLVSNYLEALKKDGSLFYDFGATPITLKASTA